MKNEIENEKLKNENERLKRLVRFQYLTLGFYKTKNNYEETRFCQIVEDGGRRAEEASQVVADLGFTGDEIRSWNGPHTCSNCGNSLKYKNIYPCECGKPEINGLDMREFRDNARSGPKI